ncbi:endolytic transglycosylase MltG [Ruminococcus sp. zg-921]|uniref:endolytic transglycosylase MltG n=1 Tax=Ruminococcus sp. zg-921 TaxID=2678506 RepID=UPI00210D7F98|nr:endolytic transglycosylase MltG [Ruminococcus sp. zg-921]MCQ4115409.1 endolytic transglycosylase MltG [Ruminococcus sp. zg-921]
MSDENKGNELTSEELVAEARKKKVQSFKLHIDNYGFNDAPPSKVREESVDELLGDIKRKVKKSESEKPSKADAAKLQGKKKNRFEAPVYVEPDLDSVKKEKEPRLETYAEQNEAIKNFTPKEHRESQTQEIERLAGRAQAKLGMSDESQLTPEELDALATAKRENEELEADEAVISSYSDEQIKKNMDLADKESLKAYKKSVKKRCKKKAKRNGCMFKLVWLVMVVFVAVLLGMFFIRGTNDMLGISRGAGPTTVSTDAEGSAGSAAASQAIQTASVDIPANATLDEVADILVESGVIKEPLFFKLYASITKAGEPFLEGSYQMETNMDYEAILNFLIYNSGPKKTISVRFTEGLNARQIAKLLEENGVCSMEKFLEACSSDKFDEDYEFIGAIQNSDERYYKLEGYLFPDTYTFFINDSVDNVVEKFLDNFNKKIYVETKRYSGYSEEMTIAQYAELKGMSIDQVINVASLVQAEAADEHDMYNIASVFYNRLSTDSSGGMTPYGDYDVNRLKSDVTVYYPYLSKDDVPDDIKDSFKSSYDTYEITGLPPGPVCNPGEKAIAAALNPNSTEYYFFCHKPATDTEAAVAYYAVTYSQQLENEIKAGLRDADDTQ